MNILYIRELELQDQEQFIDVMKKSKDFYYPFVTPIIDEEVFYEYYLKTKNGNFKSYLVLDNKQIILGVFTLSEIVRGCFQSCYLGFSANVDYAGKGIMSKAMRIVLEKIFLELKLHRVEANVQPINTSSIKLLTRCGFLKEGFSQRYLKINSAWCDHFRFALTYEDWKNLSLF